MFKLYNSIPDVAFSSGVCSGYLPVVEAGPTAAEEGAEHVTADRVLVTVVQLRSAALVQI